MSYEFTSIDQLEQVNLALATIADDLRTISQKISEMDVYARAAVDGAWKFDSTTSSADPGATFLRANHATVGSITALYISATMAVEGQSLISAAPLLGLISSSDKILLADPTGSFLARFTAGSVTNNTTWYSIAVTHVESSGTPTSGSPLSLRWIP